jgi:hypothetical protein
MPKSRQPRELSVPRSGRPTVPEGEIGQVTENGKRIPARGRIFIRPAIPEWQENADAYEAFIDALAERNISIELTEIKGIPSGGDLGAHLVPEAFAIYLGIKATDVLIENIVAEAMRRIVERAKVRWWRRGEQVKGVIYGPHGEVLREITWRSTEGRTFGGPARTGALPAHRDESGA